MMRTWVRFTAGVAFLLMSVSSISFLVGTSAPREVIVQVEYRDPPILERITAKKLAKEILTKRSFRCFTRLVGKESAWNPQAKNPHSTAKGIGQLLDGTYTNLGMKHSSNENAQLIATLAYIGRKYGSGGPCSAWDFFKRHNYY